MEQRFRWFNINPLRKPHLTKLAAAFESKAYKKDAKSGFSLATVRGDLIEGTFTERIEFTEKLTDPLGGEISIQRVEFRHTQFRISVNYPQLEIKNAPRSIKNFLNIIASALDFGIAVEAVECPPLKWAKSLANSNTAVEILAIRSTRFSLSNEIQAAISVIGTCDVRNALPALIGKRTIETDSVICGWKADSGIWRVELRAGGVARVISSPEDQPAVALRKALATLER